MSELIKKLESIKSSGEYSDQIVYDSGSDFYMSDEGNLDDWLESVDSSRDELNSECSFDDFIDAVIDALAGDVEKFNDILGYEKNQKWDDDEIIQKFEHITQIDV